MATAGKSYEAWKESQMQADAAGDVDWSEESTPVTWVGVSSIIEMKGVLTGLVLGVGFLIAAFVILAPNFKHLTQGKRTVGMVVDHKDYINRRSNTMFAPVVRYSAPGGVSDFVGGLSVFGSLYPVGKEVSVLYLPHNPGNAVIFDFAQMFMVPTFVAGLGLLCLTGTATYMYMVVRIELPPEAAAAGSTAQTIPPLATSAPQTAGSAQWGGGNDQQPAAGATHELIQDGQGNCHQRPTDEYDQENANAEVGVDAQRA